MNNEINDLRFLKEKLSGEIELPASLSRENIEKLIAEEPPKKSKKGTVRRFVAAAVAACIVITAVTLVHGNPFASSESLVENSSQQSIADSENSPESYERLLEAIKTYKAEFTELRGYNKYYYTTEEKADDTNTVYFTGSAVDLDGSVNGAVSSDTASSNTANFGEVNLRVENVKEADIFITDGQYLYCAHKYRSGISIIKAEADGTLTKVWSHTEDRFKAERDFSNTSYHGLYIYENYLIAAFSKFTFKEGTPPVTVSGVKIYDITDKSNPVLARELAVDGNYSSSRITDGQLLLVSNYRISEYFYSDCEETYFIPATYNGTGRAMLPCDCIHYNPDCKPEAYVNIAKLDLTDISKDMTVSSYLGNVQETYCTKDSLYVIGFDLGIDHTHFKVGVMISVGNGKTTITRIDITKPEAEVKESCSLEGNMLNSYSIDEHGGYLRVALTTEKGNRIVVLDKELKTVGELSGIAEGEQIKSARFMGNTAYLVTFVQTDPLFVIDLKNPEKPEILGEVKLPGFSSYLHPVGDGLLLGVGVGGTETGIDGSSKISLFDISDPANPREADNIVLPNSSLNCESKAFCKVAEDKFLIPYENWNITESVQHEDDYRYYFYTGCVMVNVNRDSLELGGSFLVKSEEPAARATFIGDNVFIMSQGEAGVASFNMESGRMLDALSDDAERIFKISEKNNEEILF